MITPNTESSFTVIAYCLRDILRALENITLPKLTSVFVGRIRKIVKSDY